MKIKQIILTCISLFLVPGFLLPASAGGLSGGDKPESCTLSVLYDNYTYLEGTRADWGFSCLVQTRGKTILFDTGTKPDILRNNCEKMGVRLDQIDAVVISHNHLDHTGGLGWVLDQVDGIRVYMPDQTPDEVLEMIRKKGCEPVMEKGPIEISEGVFLTGNLYEPLVEQALFVKTSRGITLITGCSHPGILNFLQLVRENNPEPLYMALGGFHLLSSPMEAVVEIVQEMDRMGLTCCGATHCTGDKAIALFRDHFGNNYVEMGTGRVIQID